MYRDGQQRDISEVSEVGVTIIQQFRHLDPFTHPLSSSPSVDHGLSTINKVFLKKVNTMQWVLSMIKFSDADLLSVYVL